MKYECPRSSLVNHYSDPEGQRIGPKSYDERIAGRRDEPTGAHQQVDRSTQPKVQLRAF
ncbi:unnamed protein product [Prunus brigantina]